METPGFKNSSVTCNDEMCDVLIHSKFAFCLVCKRDIGNASDASLHIRESNHKENRKILFKLCVQDPSCDSSDVRYADVVNNSMLFVSQSHDNKRSFIYRKKKSLVCLLCGEHVSNSHKVKKMQKDLVFHLDNLKNDVHLCHMKRHFSWVYCLNKPNTFVMFFDSVVYCSVCHETVDYVDNLMLHAAVGHLQTNQHKAKLEEFQSAGDMISDSQSLQVSDDNYINDQVDLCDSEDGASENQSVSNDRCENIVEENSLECPECGEVIEIYNDNADFSLQLHSQKHKDLSVVNDSSDVGYQDDADYICPVCMEPIPIFNKNVELSVTRHFEEKQHVQGPQCDFDNASEFLNNVFSNLLKEYEVHRSYFVMDGSNVICKLCSCVVQNISNNVITSSQMLTRHMLDSYHTDQHKVTNQRMTNAVISYNKDSRQRDAQFRNHLFEKLVSKSNIIRENKQYIFKYNAHYFCTVCQKQICHSPNENTQVFNFVCHLNGELHKKSLKQLLITRENKDNTLLKKSFDKMINCISLSFPQIVEEVKYIHIGDSRMTCNVCQEAIEFSKRGGNLRLHCQSVSHRNKVLMYNTVSASTKATSNQDLTNIQDNYQVMSKLAEDPVFVPHLELVQVDGTRLICLLCSITVYSSNSLKTHLLGSTHKKRTNSLQAPIHSNLNSQVKLVKGLEKQVENLLSTMANIPSLTDQMKYIQYVDEKFVCILCDVSMTVSSSGEQIIGHIHGSKHRKKVELNVENL